MNRGCHAVLAPVSRCYSPLEGRSPTCYSPVRRSTWELPPFRARLACVRHAASVDSEPGSNSPVKPERFLAVALFVLKILLGPCESESRRNLLRLPSFQRATPLQGQPDQNAKTEALQSSTFWPLYNLESRRGGEALRTLRTTRPPLDVRLCVATTVFSEVNDPQEPLILCRPRADVKGLRESYGGPEAHERARASGLPQGAAIPNDLDGPRVGRQAALQDRTRTDPLGCWIWSVYWMRHPPHVLPRTMRTT